MIRMALYISVKYSIGIFRYCTKSVDLSTCNVVGLVFINPSIFQVITDREELPNDILLIFFSLS